MGKGQKYRLKYFLRGQPPASGSLRFAHFAEHATRGLRKELL